MPEPRRFNVIETFGPTMQGEGPHAGRIYESGVRHQLARSQQRSAPASQ